jgi:hypothetical protein
MPDATISTTIGGSGAADNNGQGNNNNKGNTGNTGGGNQASGKRNNRHGNRNNPGHSTTRIETQIDKAFKDDSAELGVMMHKYFDCSGLDDQVRYTDTVEKLQIYVGETYKPFGKQIKVAIGDPSKTPQIQEVTMPQKTDSKGNLVDKTEADLSYIEKIKLNEQIKIQAQHELKLTADLASLYNFIFRRCTKFLQVKIKAHCRYTAVDDASDPLGLLSIIREIVHKIESSACLPFSIVEQTEAIFRIRQGSMSVSQYHTQFKSMLDALGTQGGDICTHQGVRQMVAKQMHDDHLISTSDVTKLNRAERIKVSISARQRFAAALFMHSSDQQRFGDYILKLKNDYKGDPDVFPGDLQTAVDTLQRIENNRP